MALKDTLMSRWANAWTQRADCYNGRHKMRHKSFSVTPNYYFNTYECKRCKVRKTAASRRLRPLDD